MADHLACYWCGHAPVQLGSACPDCGMLLEVIAPTRGHSPLDHAYVRAYKEMVVAEDRRVLALIDSLAASDFG